MSGPAPRASIASTGFWFCRSVDRCPRAAAREPRELVTFEPAGCRPAGGAACSKLRVYPSFWSSKLAFVVPVLSASIRPRLSDGHPPPSAGTAERHWAGEPGRRKSRSSVRSRSRFCGDLTNPLARRHSRRLGDGFWVRDFKPASIWVISALASFSRIDPIPFCGHQFGGKEACPRLASK